MKRFFAVSLALLVAPVLLGASSQADAPASFTQFVGSWNCATGAGSSVTMQFTDAGKGVFTAHTVWKNGVAGGSFDHVFNSKADGSWTTRQVDGTKALVFEGSSPGFSQDAITFEGTDHNGSATRPARETLRLTSHSGFSHTWYIADSGGEWHPTSFTECTKV